MEEKIDGKVYLIFCWVTLKVYVGQTIQGIEARFKQHCRDKRDKAMVSKPIRKYGKDKFSVIQIDSANNYEDLNKKEIFWIDYFDATNKEFGYNLSKGGTGNSHPIKDMGSYKKKMSEISKSRWTEEERQKKSLESKIKWKDPEFVKKHRESMKKAFSREEVRRKMSESSKLTWESQEYRDRIIPKLKAAAAKPEYKEKLSKISSKNAKARYAKKFNVYKAVFNGLDGRSKMWDKGDLIGSWEHKDACAKDLGIYWTGISQCLCGTLKQYKNYIFEYVEK